MMRGRSLVPLLSVCVFVSACRTVAVRDPGDATQDAMLAEWRQRVITDSVRAVLTRGLADSAYPAAYAVIGNARGVYASLGVGALEPVDLRPTPLDSTGAPVMNGNAAPRMMSAPTPVTDSTVWDLASLTKVIATTSAVMQLVGDGRVQLDTPATRYLPQWKAPGAENVSVRHLLTHSAGLPAWRPLYKEA